MALPSTKGSGLHAQPAWDTWDSHAAGWNLCQFPCLQLSQTPAAASGSSQTKLLLTQGPPGPLPGPHPITLGPPTLPLSCFPELFCFQPGCSVHDGVGLDLAGVCGELRPPLALPSVPCLEGTLTIWSGSILSSKRLPGIPGPEGPFSSSLEPCVWCRVQLSSDGSRL